MIDPPIVDNIPKRNWVSVDLKDFVETKLETIETHFKAIEAHFKAIEDRMVFEASTRQRAIDKAEETVSIALSKQEENMKISFQNVNEWRAAFKDREAAFATRMEVKNIEEKTSSHITRSEHEALTSEFEAKLEKVKNDLASEIKVIGTEIGHVGDRQLQLLVGIILALLGAILSIAVSLLSARS